LGPGGDDAICGRLFSYIDLEKRIRKEVAEKGGKPTSAEATMNGQLAPSPGESDGKIDLIEKFCEV
jgi:hypothetical protein